MSLYFKEIYIVKPNTSRPANSEKYLVCKYFKGITKAKLTELYEVIKLYEQHPGKIIKRFLDSDIPVDFVTGINNYNISAIANQLKYIMKTNINISSELSNENINSIKNEQCVYSLSWCIKYDFDINKKSKYLNMKLKYNYMPNFF